MSRNKCIEKELPQALLYGVAVFGLAMSVFSLAKSAMSNFSSERAIIPASDNLFQRIQDNFIYLLTILMRLIHRVLGNLQAI